METSFVESVRPVVRSVAELMATLGAMFLGAGMLCEFYTLVTPLYLATTEWSITVWLSMFF